MSVQLYTLALEGCGIQTHMPDALVCLPIHVLCPTEVVQNVHGQSHTSDSSSYRCFGVLPVPT